MLRLGLSLLTSQLGLSLVDMLFLLLGVKIQDSGC